jgi:hypothetical protein
VQSMTKRGVSAVYVGDCSEEQRELAVCGGVYQSRGSFKGRILARYVGKPSLQAEFGGTHCRRGSLC